MPSEIERFHIWAHVLDPEVTPAPNGHWVRYTDHVAALASQERAPVVTEAMLQAAMLTMGWFGDDPGEREGMRAVLESALSEHQP